MELAEHNPQAVLDAVPTLSLALEREDNTIRTYATYPLTCISESHPEERFPTLDTLLEQIEDGNQNIRSNTLSAIGHIISRYPDTAVEFAD